MHRYTGLALVCLTVLLVVFPLMVGKPGLPMTLKADEPAYYLMALSLARDHDLVCDTGDLGRLFDEYPYLAAFNVILMTDDGWHTVFFGKPYVYSLLAAPFAGLFGANGLVAFNMLLLMGMVWMGTAYLSRFNAAPLAALYSVGFFVLSTAIAYVFWLHPEVFNMTCVATSLFLVLHEFEDGSAVGRWARVRQSLFGPRLRVIWSGALLALASYNKPMLAAMALPSLFVLWKKREWGRGVLWLASAVLTIVLVSGGAILFTGHPSAYLGVERMGVQVFDPQQMPVDPVERPAAAEAPTTNSWTWLARVPDVDLGDLSTQIGYFLWGRHTGLIVYMPFAVLSVVLFLLYSRRSGVRWVTLLALVAVALFFLVWIPFNWHGGGGFVGNRYFVNVYPAFLFLVTRISPAWLIAVGYALGGFLLGPILFTPFGAPVPEPTLQAHVRNPPTRWFPLELDFRNKLPGYHGVGMSGAYFFGRKDAFQFANDEVVIHGAMPVELWMVTYAPLSHPAIFEVRNSAPANEIVIDLSGDRRELVFEGARAVRSEKVELVPRKAPIPLKEGRRTVYAYRLFVETRTGFIPNAAENALKLLPFNDFYQGARLSYLGSQEDLDRDLFSVTWGECEIPDEIRAGATFTILTRLSNASDETWPAQGTTRVNLSYHWLEPEDGQPLEEGRRTGLPRDLEPGGAVEVEQVIRAPEQPGTYVLELDLVRERVSWFARRRPGQTPRFTVEVLPDEATAGSPEP
jgi:hypothetical protein